MTRSGRHGPTSRQVAVRGIGTFAAAWAAGVLLFGGTGTAQEPAREIPCENGTAGGYACDRVDLLSRLSREELGAADSILLNDVWGWTDPATGREYALVGRMDGVAFVDVTEHNLYVHGDRLYITDRRAGLRVLDIGDPENPGEAGHFDTTSPGADTSRFVGAWSVYPFFESGSVLVSSRSGGLFVVRPR